ncbi:MAG: ABC transporter substrate-binding protein, partial [Chloroflexota bacterium]|nr:ABC transporter substrate-binding protein [Chloroflexota bacterium]
MANPQVAPTKSPWRPPTGTINVFDPSPLNWLFITWNTMEEPIRVDQDGRTVPALATDARWIDDHTLELALRTGVRFQDGEPFTAHSIKQNFDEMQRWIAPHPPGSWLNFSPESVCEV